MSALYKLEAHTTGSVMCSLLKKALYAMRKIKFIELNLIHFQGAQDFVNHSIYENKIDIAVVCEQYLKFGVWTSDESGKSGFGPYGICSI